MIGPINSTTGELYIAVYPTKSTGYGLIVPYDAIKSEIEKSQANTTTTNNNNTTLIAFLVIFIILFVGLLSGVIIGLSTETRRMITPSLNKKLTFKFRNKNNS